VIPDFSHPVWWPFIAFVWLSLAAMIWFPIYYWRKDRKRRQAESEKDKHA
jgi:hypothetical protein